MDVQAQHESSDKLKFSEGLFSDIPHGTDTPRNEANANVFALKAEIKQLDKANRMELAIKELQIGKRIQSELKEQGRSVSWLAKKLGMERTSLYYTFRQNSINVELLLRISCLIGHNFLKDVYDVFIAYEL